MYGLLQVLKGTGEYPPYRSGPGPEIAWHAHNRAGQYSHRLQSILATFQGFLVDFRKQAGQRKDNDHHQCSDADEKRISFGVKWHG